MKHAVCTSETLIHDVDEAPTDGSVVWVQQSVINEATDQCCKRLHACVKANGRYFEHLL